MSGPNITHYLTKINQQLANVWPTDSSTKLGQQLNVGLEEQLALNALTMPLNALLQRAGKRWRPLVMVLTAQSFGQNEEDSLYFTPLVELPHSGSLVIDDIEDGSTLRRQLPAIHLMYGLDCAINSANLAYFSPTSLIDNYRCNDKLKYLIYKSYSKAMRSVHLGQGLDIAWHNDALFIPNVQQYYTMCRLKTGALAAMAAEVGALVAQQSDDFANQLGQVWQDIGLGFQIADDVGNIEGTIAGKEQGDDIIEGKKSLAVILFNQSYNSQTFKLLHYIKQAKTGNKEAVKQACQLLQQSKVIDEAKTLGNHYLEEGHKKLKQLLPFNNYSTLLFNLVAKLKG